MFWIILTVLFAIAVVVLVLMRRRLKATLAPSVPDTDEDGVRSYERDERRARRDSQERSTRRRVQVLTISAIATVGVWLIITALMSVRAVGAGEVGIVRQFGGIVGQQSEGVAFIAPWQSMDKVSIRTERRTFGSIAEPITAASSETQDVFVIATINYSVSSTNVQKLIREVGTNWFDILVPTRVNQYIKQETAKWKTIDIIPNRETIRQAVLARLRADLGENYSITVSDFLIDNIAFSQVYTDAIEAKQVATENAQAEQNRTVQVQEVANQGVIQAQGEADQVVALAEGQAEANNLITESLTPELLQWQAIQVLGPNVDIALIPSGEGFILDPSTILATEDTQP